jgi:hypothetical protein
MSDPFVFAVCIEALRRGGEPAFVEAGAMLEARAMRATIAMFENDGPGLNVVLCERK